MIQLTLFEDRKSEDVAKSVMQQVVSVGESDRVLLDVADRIRSGKKMVAVLRRKGTRFYLETYNDQSRFDFFSLWDCLKDLQVELLRSVVGPVNHSAVEENVSNGTELRRLYRLGRVYDRIQRLRKLAPDVQISVFYGQALNREMSATHVGSLHPVLLLPDWKKEAHLRMTLPEAARKDEIPDWSERSILKSVLDQFDVDLVVPPSLDGFYRQWIPRYVRDLLWMPYTETAEGTSLDDRVAPGTVLKTLGKKKFHTQAGGEVCYEGEVVVMGRRNEMVESEEGDTIQVEYELSVRGEYQYYWSGPLEGHFVEVRPFDNKEMACRRISNVIEDRTSRNLEKIEALGLPLFDHVKKDLAEAIEKERVIFGNPPRLGKTSQMIAYAEAMKAKRVLVVCVKNGRQVFVDEFKRLGIPAKDVIVVDKLSDLDKPGRYYLVTYSWIRGGLTGPSKKVVSKFESGKIYQELSRMLISRTAVHGRVAVSQIVDMCHGLSAEQSGSDRERAKALFSQWLRYARYFESGRFWPKRFMKVVGSVPVSVFLAMCPEPFNHPDSPRARKNSELMLPDQMYKVLNRQPTDVPVRADYMKARYRFDLIMVDEIHHAKNPASKQYKALMRLHSPKKACASGTLLSAGPMDIHGPLTWLLSDCKHLFPYDNPGTFAKVFVDRVIKTEEVEVLVKNKDNTTQVQKVKKKKEVHIPYVSNLKLFWSSIRGPWICRRNYEDPVVTESLEASGRRIPDIAFRYEFLEPGPQQKVLIASCIDEFKAMYEEYKAKLESAETKTSASDQAAILHSLRLMRFAATIPGKLQEMASGIGDRKLYTGDYWGCKQNRILDLVEQWAAEGRKTVVFSDFVSLRTKLEEILEPIGAVHFQTSWDDAKRTEVLEEFRYNDDLKVLICGPRTIREAVDLSVATRAITTDLLWTPAILIQAWSRLRTPKQNPDPVECHILLTRLSIDEHIYKAFYSRLQSMDQAVDFRRISGQDSVVNIRTFVEKILLDKTYLDRWNVEINPEDDLLAQVRPVIHTIHEAEVL